MNTYPRSRWTLTLVMAALLSALTVYGQDSAVSAAIQDRPDILKVLPGQKMSIEGIITDREADNIVVKSPGGGLYKAVISSAEIKEKKINPLRGAKKYTGADLILGLIVEVKGVGDDSGSIDAREVRFKNDDVLLARTMDARVVPVENTLKDTQIRLGETEQNAQRLSGQIRELTAITDSVRDSANAAQASADGAMSEAKNARSTADGAKAGVKTTNERITALDDYEAKTVTAVNFKVGSASLSDGERERLDEFARSTQAEKGFLIEVAGFASSDGDEALNRRLSQKRADAVIQYLVENHAIPLRRFVVPMGYGEKNPVADNSTREGRKENRRVEVRVLVSRGLISGANSQEVADSSMYAQ